MEETGEVMSIGVFARRAGLAPSAPRFYDDCGVLCPARTDEATGYRYYAPYQERRAVLEEHARRTRETAERAQPAIEEILGPLPGGASWTRARVGGAEPGDFATLVIPVHDTP